MQDNNAVSPCRKLFRFIQGTIMCQVIHLYYILNAALDSLHNNRNMQDNNATQIIPTPLLCTTKI